MKETDKVSTIGQLNPDLLPFSDTYLIAMSSESRQSTLSSRPRHRSNSKNHTVSVCFAKAYLACGERMGLTREGLLNYAAIPEAVISETAMTQPQGKQAPSRLAPYQLARLLHRVMVEGDDEFMGLTQRRARFGIFTLLAERLIYCETLGEALQEARRFYSLVTGAVNLELEEEGPLTYFRLYLDKPELDPDSVLMELLMLVWHRFPSWLIGEVIPLHSVHMRMPRPAHADEYPLLFPCLSLFGQQYNALVMPTEVLQHTIHRGPQELKQYLAKVPLVWFRKQHFFPLQTQRVMQILKHSEDLQSVSLEDIALQIHVTSRTLRRRLVAEGSRFQTLKDTVRRERAIFWLSQDSSIKDTAQRCGYTETASFIRAFRGWTGQSPGQYRKALAGTRNP